MASAVKRRKTGMLDQNGMKNVILQYLPSNSNTTEATKTLKRNRIDEAEEDRPAKQARRDDAADSQTTRATNTIRSSSSKASSRPISADQRQEQMRQAAEAQKKHQRFEAMRAARLAALEKQQNVSEASTAIPQALTYQKASESGLLPPKKKEGSAGQGAGSMHSSTPSQNVVPGSDGTPTIGTGQTDATLATSRDPEKFERIEGRLSTIEKDLEQSNEIRRKSEEAQAQHELEIERLQEKHKEEMTRLQTKLDEEARTIETQNSERKELEDKLKQVMAHAESVWQEDQEKIKALTQENEQALAANGEQKQAIASLQEQNAHLEKQPRLAQESENGVRMENLQLQNKLAAENQATKNALRERNTAQEALGEAEDKVKSLMKTGKAFMGILGVIPGVKFLKPIPYINADVDTDEPQDDSSDYLSHREYVELPESLFGGHAQATSQPKASPFDAFARPQPATLTAPTTFGKPSYITMPATGSSSDTFNNTFAAPKTPSIPELFGRDGPPVTPNFGNLGTFNAPAAPSSKALDDLQRKSYEMEAKMNSQDQELRGLREYTEKLKRGENAEPPPNPGQRRFEQYVNHLVADKFTNGMITSAGAPAAFALDSNNDAGIFDAPEPYGAVTSAYVDFSNAETFGPDGWPMQTDDNAYQKGVNRQNNKSFENTGFQGKGKGKQKVFDDNRGDNFHNNDGWKPDPNAGKIKGLDRIMGDNPVADHSKEESIWQNANKRKNDEHHSGFNGKHGGKNNNNNKGKNQNNSNNNSNKQQNNNNRGGKANNQNGKGQQNNHNNGDNGGRGGKGGFGGGRGGRGGRGRGRGSDDANGDAVAGAPRSFTEPTLQPGEVGPNEMETEFVQYGGQQFVRDDVKALSEAIARENAAVEDPALAEDSGDLMANSDEDLDSPRSPPLQLSKRQMNREDRSSGYGANGSNARGRPRFNGSHSSAADPYESFSRARNYNRSNGPGPRRDDNSRAPRSNFNRPNGPGPFRHNRSRAPSPNDSRSTGPGHRRHNDSRARGMNRREPCPQPSRSYAAGLSGGGRKTNQNISHGATSLHESLDVVPSIEDANTRQLMRSMDEIIAGRTSDAYQDDRAQQERAREVAKKKKANEQRASDPRLQRPRGPRR